MSFRAKSSARLVVAVLALFVLAGCEKAGKQTAQQQPPAGQMPPAQDPHAGMPAGSAPFAGGMKDLEGPLDDNPVPLRVEGLSSAAELNRDKAGLADESVRRSYEEAFRLSFAAKMAQRDYARAVDLSNKVVAAQPDFAPGYRVLGYALFNTQRGEEALGAYKKSLEINPNYGEVHYALAFMYAMGDQVTGREHFRKAMELGIPDERNLGTRFYPPTQ